jgi:hypothetical protein
VNAATPTTAHVAPLGAPAEEWIDDDSIGRATPVFVVPCRGAKTLRASIRGHVLELADPDSGRGLAPTPDDLRVTAIASDVAWFARRFLRDRGLDDYASVTTWPGAEGVDVGVTVCRSSEDARAALSAALEREYPGAFPGGRVRFQVRAE